MSPRLPFTAWPFTTRSFTTRLSLALALLLLAYGAFVALLGRQVAAEQEQESSQRLSRGLANHIVGHWPEIASPHPAMRLTARRVGPCCPC
jgi:hypothetical protein